MKFVPAKCPSCGADIQLDNSRGQGFCLYCGTQLIVDEAIRLFQGKVEIDYSAKIENYNSRAYRFFQNKQYEEAEKYCNLVLDLDINNEEANKLLMNIKNQVTKPNVMISCIDPSSSSKTDSVYVNGERQKQTINPYGHLTLPVGKYTVYIEAGGFSSKPLSIQITSNQDEYEIKYKKAFLKTTVELIKLR